jgi:hypothetical protein
MRPLARRQSQRTLSEVTFKGFVTHLFRET